MSKPTPTERVAWLLVAAMLAVQSGALRGCDLALPGIPAIVAPEPPGVPVSFDDGVRVLIVDELSAPDRALANALASAEFRAALERIGAEFRYWDEETDTGPPEFLEAHKLIEESGQTSPVLAIATGGRLTIAPAPTDLAGLLAALEPYGETP